MSNAEHTLSLIRQALEDLDRQYMDDDVESSGFAEHILDVLAEIVPYERTKDYEAGRERGEKGTLSRERFPLKRTTVLHRPRFGR